MSDDRQAALGELAKANAIETAEAEARASAAWLAAHGYETSVWTFSTALDNYGPESRRTFYAHGYAMKYDGRLARDDGTTAEYPAAGITIWCQDTQLDLGNLIRHGRALVTFRHGDFYEPYVPYYVAGWNPRQTGVQRDQEINPGILPHAHLHVLTPLAVTGDGPKRFYDLRLDPAGDLATGTRVRVVSSGTEAEYAASITAVTGQEGVIRHPHATEPTVELDPQYDPVADTTRPYGQLRQIPRDNLDPVSSGSS